MRNQKLELAILVKTELASGYGLNAGYFHVYGEIVTLEGGKVRGIPDSRYDAVNGFPMLNGIRTHSQGNNDERPRGLYAFRPEYYEERFVDLDKAERMSKTLAKIARGLNKLELTRGNVRSYGEYVGRIAEVVGATKIVEVVAAGSRPYHSANEYRVHDLGDGIRYIDNAVQRWKDAGDLSASA